MDAIRRTNPRRDPTRGGATRFEGWARMATPISGVSITEVKKPNLGEKVPAEVRILFYFFGRLPLPRRRLRCFLPDVNVCFSYHPIYETEGSSIFSRISNRVIAGAVCWCVVVLCFFFFCRIGLSGSVTE